MKTLVIAAILLGCWVQTNVRHERVYDETYHRCFNQILRRSLRSGYLEGMGSDSELEQSEAVCTARSIAFADASDWL